MLTQSGVKLSTEAVETSEMDGKVPVVTPTIDGVAIPNDEAQNTDSQNEQNDCNVSDSQENTENTQSSKTSLKKQKTKNPQTRFETLWYVALTNTKCERKVEEQIKAQDLYLHTWVPTEVGKHNTIHNYVFFHFSKSDERDYSVKAKTFTMVRSIMNVNALLTAPDEYTPTAIPNAQVERFRKAIRDQYHEVEFVKDAVSVGEKVRVVKGSLAGIEGTVERISEEKSQLYIALSTLGCAIVQLGKDDEYELVNKKDTQDDSKAKDITDDMWLSRHPYSEMQSEDYKYVAFANKLVAVLDKQSKSTGHTRHKRLALPLTCYIEDKRSGLGLFHYLVASLPFNIHHPIEPLLPKEELEEKMKELMSDYDEKALNAIDIAYILLVNDISKSKDIDSLMASSRSIIERLQKMRYDRLTPNRMYFRERRNLLETEGWEGLKKFLLWIVNAKSVFVPNAETISPLPELLVRQSATEKVSPLQYAIDFAIRTRVTTSVLRKMERLQLLPPKIYEVIGSYRKVIHFKDEAGEIYKSSLDNTSKGVYTVGEKYQCVFAKYDDKLYWYHVVSPVKQSL